MTDFDTSNFTHFEIYCVNDCDFNCHYCSTMSTNKLKTKMNINHLKFLLFALKSHQRQFTVSILGGEPSLLKQDLTFLITELHSIELCMKILLFTNLNNIDSVLNLPNSNINKLKIIGSYHYYQHNNNLFFENISIIEKSNINYSINFLISKQTIKEIQNILELFKINKIKFKINFIFDFKFNQNIVDFLQESYSDYLDIYIFDNHLFSSVEFDKYSIVDKEVYCYNNVYTITLKDSVLYYSIACEDKIYKLLPTSFKNILDTKLSKCTTCDKICNFVYKKWRINE